MKCPSIHFKQAMYNLTNVKNAFRQVDLRIRKIPSSYDRWPHPSVTAQEIDDWRKVGDYLGYRVCQHLLHPFTFLTHVRESD